MKKTFLTAIVLLLTSAAFSQPVLSTLEKEGTDDFKSGKTTEAIAAFKKALTENPKSLYSINALSTLYLANKQSREAYDIAGKGIQLAPGAPNFIIFKARAAMQLNKPQEAVDLIDAYAGKSSPDYYMLSLKGMAQNALGNTQQAILMFSQSIAANPDFADNYLARGKSFSKIERYPQALQDYDKYISLVNDDAEGYNERGIALFKTNKNNEAIADYTKALQLNRKYVSSYSNRGVAYRAAGAADKALSDFNAAIALDTGYADAYYESSIVYYNAKDYAKASAAIDKAVSLKSNYASFYAEQSLIDLYTGKDADALAAAEKVLQLDPGNAEGFTWKAVAQNNLNRVDQALQTASAGISKNPGYYLLYSVRANFYRQKGNTALADADDAKAKELGTK